MNNAEKFQEVFGYYATEMWAKPESEFLEWINSEYVLKEDTAMDKEQKSKLESEKVQLFEETPTNKVDTPTNAPTDLISRQAATDIVYRSYTRDDAVNDIYELPPVADMGEVSDGFHTFNQLYHQRAVLFATIVNQNKDKAWKSWKHEDGKFCFDKGGEWFVVGIDTPGGSYTYHYEQKYWDMFDCEELERGKHWDGHTEDDVTRLLSLPPVEPQRPRGEWIEYIDDRNGRRYDECPSCHKTTLNAVEYDVLDGERHTMNYCPNCGADMRGTENE